MSDDVKKLPMKVIKDKSEYDSYKAELEDFLNEHYWLTHTSNPIEEVSKDTKDALRKLDDVERGSKEESEILKRIHLLQVKYDLIKDGSYESRLIQNIKAETMMLDEYELRNELNSFGKFMRGIVTGDSKARKLLGYMILRGTGREAMPERIDVTPSSKVLLDLAKNYESSWVDINSNEIEEKIQNEVGLVPYQDVAVSTIETNAEKSLQEDVARIIQHSEEASIKRLNKENALNSSTVETGVEPQIKMDDLNQTRNKRVHDKSQANKDDIDI